jgi:hypothetical protein
MFDGAKSVFGYALTAGAVLLVLGLIGVVNQHVPLGMTAVGDGISDLIKWIGDLISHI